MWQIAMPNWLHAALGEEQSAFLLAAVFGVGMLAALAVIVAEPGLHGLAIWRSLLAMLPIFDIAAGCVANFTPATNGYYSSRSRGRRLFIIAHIHLPVVGLLVGWPMAAVMAIWAWTIATAALVNAMRGHPLQPTIGGLGTVLGMIAAPVVAPENTALLIVAPLFLFKVAYAFAVDHQRSLERT